MVRSVYRSGRPPLARRGQVVSRYAVWVEVAGQEPHLSSVHRFLVAARLTAWWRSGSLPECKYPTIVDGHLDPDLVFEPPPVARVR